MADKMKVSSTINDRKIPELLAPVGGWPQLKAAVQNGADAVYMGGALFNARMKAENFSMEDMKNAIDYAHLRNVKAYITINTLIKDNELFKALSYINDLYALGADAVILQDMGLARLVRKYLPDMEMHLSTQGTVYNKWAVDMVKDLGFSRVVPARELSLAEIREFTEECHAGEIPCEVEVFVHGALCMCYSGQCQMSRVLGGGSARSGNRGLCAQPCRLPYEDENGRTSYFLSPKDICTLEDLPQLCRAGVDSLKIEGRLKSPQYVAVVTSIYRRYLDEYRETGDVKVQAADLQKLVQIFNRGGFSKGYLYGNPGEKLLSGESPKNQGVLVGKVKAVKKGSTLVDVKLMERRGSTDDAGQHPLSTGDGVEIRGRKITGNVLSYLKELPDGSLRIGDIKESVSVGDALYRVTQKSLLTEAELSYADDFARKVPVEMRFTAALGKLPRLCMREQGTEEWQEVCGDAAAEQALNRPLDEERVRKQLARLGDTGFEAVSIAVQIDDNIAIPVSTMNHMRREAAKRLQDFKCEAARMGKKALASEMLAEISDHEALRELRREAAEAQKPLGTLLHLYGGDEPALKKNLTRIETEKVEKKDGLRLCIPIEIYMVDGKMSVLEKAAEKYLVGMKTGHVFMPYILNISKGNLDAYIEKFFCEICEKARDTGILIGNLGWIKRFQAAGIKVYGDYGLNVYNRQSRKAFEELGVEILALSHEAETASFRNVPLMITEHPVSVNWIKDRKGKVYDIVQCASGDKFLILEARI